MKMAKRILSLALVLVMVACMSVTVFATSENPSVTVYATTGMFTLGGIDANENFVDQEFIGGNPAGYLIANYEPFEATAEYISYGLAAYREVYNSQLGASSPVNVLDAIIFSLEANSYTCTGGWDSYTGPNGDLIPGGYVHNVTGARNYPGTVTVTSNALTKGGVSYDRYSGDGWKMMIKYPNGTYETPEHYGTYYPIVDGMEIIFDYSPYVIYDVHQGS